MSTYSPITGLANINNLMAQNAFVIGEEISVNALNTSRWYSVIPKGTLPNGLGDNLASLVYDKSLPTKLTSSLTTPVVGSTWTRVGQDITTGQTFNQSTALQPNEYAAGSHIGPTGTGGTSLRDRIAWTKKLRPYFLERCEVESPYVNIFQMMQAAALDQQIAAVTEALTSATKWVWERRLQEQYELMCANLVPCLTTGTPILSTVDSDTDSTADDPFFGVPIAAASGTRVDFATSGAGNTNVLPTAGLSNKILDRIKTRLDIVTPLNEAYGVDNGVAVHLLMIGSDASYAIQTESGIREDLRKSNRVDDLLKPLGVDESFRGFFHMKLPDPPRFTESGGYLTRVEPLDEKGNYNSAYDTAPYEAAYVIHKNVMESQVPNPGISTPGFTFNPANFAGEFEWVNNKNDVTNPKGHIGFFLATFGSAGVPKKVEYGYAIVFKRDSAPAA
jgi:hypothetical protein